MKKNTKTFNALKTLTEVAKLMESSTDRMIRLYDPEFTASGNADERSRRKPDNQLISAMEPQLREQVDQLATTMTYLELSTEPGYMDSFVAACFLPHTDANLFPSVEL